MTRSQKIKLNSLVQKFAVAEVKASRAEDREQNREYLQEMRDAAKTAKKRLSDYINRLVEEKQ